MLTVFLSLQLITFLYVDCQDISTCSLNPCKNNGLCYSSLDNKPICLCLPGYTGLNCEQTTVCASSPCSNGYCQDDNKGGYLCVCNQGFTGIRCETKIDYCLSKPCLNGGTCLTIIGGYICTCPLGLSGFNCQTNAEPFLCLLSPCKNGGTCLGTSNGKTCICPIGFNGNDCEINSVTSTTKQSSSLTSSLLPVANQCASSPCKNGGTCLIGVANTYSCLCPIGYSGINCEIIPPTNPCNSSPCKNNGICLSLVNIYNCVCQLGYSGINCDVVVTNPITTTRVSSTIQTNNCLSLPCKNGGSCSSSSSGYSCICLIGFSGVNCELQPLTQTTIKQVSSTIQTNNCLSAPCLNGGLCSSSSTGYICICPVGYSGINCNTFSTNNCLSSPCKNGGSCSSSSSGYSCKCFFGFSGVNCELQPSTQTTIKQISSTIQTNNCLSVSCMNGGTCENLNGSFKCKCLPNFSGISCETKLTVINAFINFFTNFLNKLFKNN